MTQSTRPAVLVVEDDLLLRLDTTGILEDAGFDVIETGNADEAIQVLEAREDIRIVFTDIQMPGSMDGIRLAAAIRERWPPIELILTSGRKDIRQQDIPERAQFFAKPFSPNEVISAMRGFLGH